MRTVLVLAAATLLVASVTAATADVFVAARGPCIYNPVHWCGPGAVVEAYSPQGVAIETRVNGGPWTPYSGPVPVPPVTGTHLVEARALADGAVVGTDSLLVPMDATPPTIRLDRPVAGWVYTDWPVPAEWPSESAAQRGVAMSYEIVPIEGAVADAHAGFARWQLWVDDRPRPSIEFGEAVFDHSYGFLDGLRTLRFVAWDRLGNTAEHVVLLDHETVVFDFTCPQTQVRTGLPWPAPGSTPAHPCPEPEEIEEDSLPQTVPVVRPFEPFCPSFYCDPLPLDG